MRLVLTILSFIFCFIGHSQVEFTASVNYNQVALNEVFTYEIISNQSNCQIYQPEFGGLTIVGGPYQSTSNSVMIVNGKRTQNKQTKYTYQLRGTKKGNYTIKAAQMKCDDKTYKTQPITVKISIGTEDQANVSSSSNKDFFIRISSSKSTVYQGEPFVVSLKMFSKKQPRGIEEIQFGEANGISKKDLNPNKQSYDTKQEIINGVRYYTVVLKQELCYAHKSGELSIEPYYLSALFNKGFFQQYRQDGYSNTLKIKVKDLPANQPKNFNGLVGEFELDFNLNKNKVKSGEAIDLNITISGKGNLNSFDDPVLDLPKDFDQFDPDIKNNVTTKSNGTSGSISYDFVLVPTFYGDYTIPAYSFSYFDLNTKQYKTLSTGEFKIEVEKPNNAHGEIITQKKEVDIDETDIRFIHKNDLTTFTNSDLKAGSLVHYFSIGMPFLILWVILFMKKRQNNLSDEDRIKLIKKKAKKSASKYLDNCKQLYKQGKNADAIKELSAGLKAFLKFKLNLTESDLSAKSIGNHLTDETTKSKFTSIWNTIEMYQYSPVNASQIDALIQDTEAIINTIDKQL